MGASVLEESQTAQSSMVSVSQSALSNSGAQQSSGGPSLPVDAHGRQRDYFKVLQDMQEIRKKFQIKQLKPEETIHTFQDILRLRRGFGATDARDMIFDHLGIAADSAKEMEISADYDISDAELFTKVARSIIIYSESLEILLYVEDEDPSLRRPGLPSWVPDWKSTEFHDGHFVSLWMRRLDYIGIRKKLFCMILAEHPLYNIPLCLL